MITMINYVTETQFANKIHTNKKRVAKWRQAGLIIGVKSGRQWIYRESDIDEFYDKYLGKDLSADHYKHFIKK